MNTIHALIRSSSDPASVSLFIKSLATFLVLFGLDATIINDAGGYVINIVTGVAMIISALTALIGIARKVKLGRWNAPDPYSED